MWAKWLEQVIIVFSVVYLMSEFRANEGIQWLLMGLLAIIILSYRLVVQKFDLLLDGHPVRIKLYMTISGRIWMIWEAQSVQGKVGFGQSYGLPFSVDHEIELDGNTYKLGIHSRRFPDGFMISNNGLGFDMKVVSNSFCFWQF